MCDYVPDRIAFQRARTVLFSCSTGISASHVAGRGEAEMNEGGATFWVGQAVRVYPGTDRDRHGVVLDDFGEIAGQSVDIANTRIAGPARRWAVGLDSGELVFVDTDQLAPG